MINFGSNEEFIQNYNKLKSARKMAQLYHCNKTSILNHAKKIGYDNKHNKEIKIVNVPVEQIFKDYNELGSCEKVGQKYACSKTAVRNYLTKFGYALTNINNKLDKIEEVDFIKKYEELKSAEKMSKYYNCSSTAILNYAKKIGYDVNNKDYKLTKQDKDFILQNYKTLSSNQLAKKFNVSRGMITKLWFDAGLIGKETIITNTTEIDLSNQTFGAWTVLYKTDKRSSNGNILWHCRCRCGIEKDISGASLRNGTSLSCGTHSNISKGNEKIKNILFAHNIPFEIEKTFDTCQDRRKLPFDFFVNNSYLIEYDGLQHFDLNSKFDYEYTHSHDIIKTEWCKQNNMPLIRIPYTHYDKLCIQDLLLESTSFLVNYADDKSSKIGEILQLNQDNTEVINQIAQG